MSTSVNKFIVSVAGAAVAVFSSFHSASRPVEAVIVGVTAALVYLVPNKKVAAK
jgi:hypothetical protein